MTLARNLVSAGAGSGKTWRIVKTLLDAVEAGTAVERLAAVTFTEAAARELQARLRARLLEAGRLEDAARVEVAAICTIHQFALRLVEQYPLAAGLPPSPLKLDEPASRAMVRRCLGQRLRDDASGRFQRLFEQSLGPGLGLSLRGFGDSDTPEGRLQALVLQLLEKARSLALNGDSLKAEAPRAVSRVLAVMGPSGAAEALDGAFRDGLDEAFGWLDANPLGPPRKTDQGLYDALKRLRAEPQGAVYDQAVALQRPKRSKGFEKEFPRLVAAVDAVVETHPEARARLAAAVEGVFVTAAETLDAYARDKARMGALDFEDMQLRALELLRGNEGRSPYAALVAEAFPLVVVDEFQDTSPLQYQLFEQLRAAGSIVHYVGDLKQGIYGFRTADAALFGALLDTAAAHGDRVDTLDRSRRSRPSLVAFANAMFSALLPKYDMAFEPLVADNLYARGEAPEQGPNVELLWFARPHQNGERIRAGAQAIERLLARGMQVWDRHANVLRPLRRGDITILAYSHGMLSKWAEALSARGIATQLESPGLADTLEVQLARAWFAMLASPRDGVAAASVLLSELYGLSQRAVVQLSLARVSGSPRRALAKADAEPGALSLTDFERRALLRCDEDLTVCRRWLRQLPLGEAVGRCLAQVQLVERLSLRLDRAGAEQLRANVNAMVAEAHALAALGNTQLGLRGASGATLENYLLALASWAEREPSQPRIEAADEAVQLVTLHGSKGMEYPVVVLDILTQEMQRRLPRVEVLRPGEGEPDGRLDREALMGPGALEQSGLLLLPEVAIEPHATALRSAWRGDAQLVSEWLRLFYVAVTRAREHLVLLWPAEGGGATRRLRDVVAAHLPEAPPAGRPEGADATWLGVAVKSWLIQDEAVTAAAPARAASLVEIRDALDAADAETVANEAAPAAPQRPRVRLATVSPTELCQVADCPEVPRIARFAKAERHDLARSEGVPITVRTLRDARRARERVPREVGPARIGLLVHAAVERAQLGPSSVDDALADRALANQVMAEKGQTEFVAELVTLVVETLGALRETCRLVGAVGEPAREVPFVCTLAEGALTGVVDLVVPAADGLHVVDLKTHLLPEEKLALWAGYYQPQLDAYAYAIERLTGSPVMGRHLAVPAAAALVTLPDRFDGAKAAETLGRYADAIATEARGPARPCAHCGWRDLCRVGKQQSPADAAASGAEPEPLAVEN